MQKGPVSIAKEAMFFEDFKKKERGPILREA
jgi:hypothetical protein